MTVATLAIPVQPLLHLDAVWIQVAGTRCNLECRHCFVAAGPTSDRHGMLSRDRVRDRVAEGLALGAREFYFTGGEPFLHPDLLDILADTLALAPCTVLTNGTLLPRARVEALGALVEASRHSLEIRVSLDGVSAPEHDSLRGAGAFARAIDGLRRLDAAGLLPIATVTNVRGEDPLELRERVAALLRGVGVARPRIKLLPLFALGRELERAGAARVPERNDATDRPRDGAATERPPERMETMLAGLDSDALRDAPLPCATCRAVTSRGVFVCPLLVDEPDALLGDTLAEAARPFALRHAACATCWTTGATCGNA